MDWIWFVSESGWGLDPVGRVPLWIKFKKRPDKLSGRRHAESGVALLL